MSQHKPHWIYEIITYGLYKNMHRNNKAFKNVVCSPLNYFCSDLGKPTGTHFKCGRVFLRTLWAACCDSHAGILNLGRVQIFRSKYVRV